MITRFVLIPVTICCAWFLCGCSGEPREASETGRQAAQAPAKILHFYGSPGIVERGDNVTLCYGVENADAVRIEPEIEPIRPALNRCIQFAPKQDATYTLIATGADGNEVSESLTIQVQGRKSAPQTPARQGRMITAFAASASEIAPGHRTTLCYGVRNADSVRIQPPVGDLQSDGTHCIVVVPERTTTYTLTASGAGQTEQAEVTIRVR